MTERDFLADLELTRQNFYKTAQLPQSKASFGRDIRKIQAAEITSYAAAYQFLMDESNNPKLRHNLLHSLFRMWVYGRMWQRTEFLDRPEILPALVVCLKDRHPDIRDKARQLVEYLELRECVPQLLHMIATDKSRYNRIFAMSTLAGWHDPEGLAALLALAADRSKSDFLRTHAIFCLGRYPANPLIREVLERVMVDASESVDVRTEASGELAYMGTTETVLAYLRLLGESNAELRLWGVYGLATIGSQVDIAAAIPSIDRVVAYDMAVASGWWSVASTAMRALEQFWYQRLAPNVIWVGATYLIGPLLEYFDFQAASYVVGDGDEAEFVPIQQTTTLSIDPATLAKQIVERWPAAKINVRHPQPEALVLDWLIEEPEKPLVGGLHCNGYWVFLTGEHSEIADFAAWLRRIVPMTHPLRLYCWGDPSGETKTDIVGEIKLDEAGQLIRRQFDDGGM